MKLYLVVYNIISILGWAYVLVGTIVHLFDFDSWSTSSTLFASLSKKLADLPYLSSAVPFTSSRGSLLLEPYVPVTFVPVLRRATTLYSRIGIQTAIIQSFASLEIIHALLGWVGSSPVTTAVQVWTRLEAVWGIAYLFPQVKGLVDHHVLPH